MDLLFPVQLLKLLQAFELFIHSSHMMADLKYTARCSKKNYYYQLQYRQKIKISTTLRKEPTYYFANSTKIMLMSDDTCCRQLCVNIIIFHPSILENVN